MQTRQGLAELPAPSKPSAPHVRIMLDDLADAAAQAAQGESPNS